MVKKDGSMSVCNFFTSLNKALEVYQFPLLNPKDIFATLRRGTLSLYTARSYAYFQIEEDNKIKNYLLLMRVRAFYSVIVFPLE